MKSLDYLRDEKYFDSSTTDKYFVKHDKPAAFRVCGKMVIVDSEKLGTGIEILAGSKAGIDTDVLFLRYTDVKIGRLYG